MLKEIVITTGRGLILTINGNPIPKPRAYNAVELLRQLQKEYTLKETMPHEQGYKLTFTAN